MHLSTLLALLPILVNGHMQMITPFALNQQDNPNARFGTIDYNYAAPLDKAGADYPCKGHLSALGGPAGASVATWKAGTPQYFAIKGSANHNGGSCQASLSEDNGKSFRVIKSYIGSCPIPSKAYSFTVPKGTASGPAIFAWTWFNNQGNREMYMNCASVTITDGGSGMGGLYPYIFRANIGNGCATEAGTDVIFPNPGMDVENISTKATPPIGNCGPAGPGPVGTAMVSTSAMEATIPSKAVIINPVAPSGTAKTTETSPATTGSAYSSAKRVGMPTPSSAPATKTGCSCICDGYTFQFSPDEL
ncbi:hypothetical protein L873DRAFT_1770461 [Choiromyces venosus 120613-1]|uniref:Lytic polysaccharide monooxygenase n=1 Tax=Choiromyces venosus 120613-1 TaxID=1336337 RepID=A0A3N4JNI3_9PEZI|nr:hypothetical protein L873DRAFT_1770461 [Choiromyces venosus 120613-1]